MHAFYFVLENNYIFPSKKSFRLHLISPLNNWNAKSILPSPPPQNFKNKSHLTHFHFVLLLFSINILIYPSIIYFVKRSKLVFNIKFCESSYQNKPYGGHSNKIITLGAESYILIVWEIKYNWSDSLKWKSIIYHLIFIMWEGYNITYYF